jgi:hypothetical protein
MPTAAWQAKGPITRFVFGDGLPALALGLIVVCTVFRPGDAQWISDEPMLLHGALYMNSTPSHFWNIPLPFTPSPYGLIGTRGVHYGPLAVWIDQIFLVFTRNPITMIAIRAAVVAAIDALALFWLAKSLRATPWLAVAVMLSPWLWLYTRQLWDNSLCIPMSAMLLAAYADFINTHRRWSLRLAILCGMLLLLLHLMAIPLIAAVAIHLAVVESRSLWRFKWSLLAIVAITTALSLPYWSNLLHNHQQKIPSDTSALRGYFYPLFGAHHLTTFGLENVLGDEWLATRPPIVAAAQWISLIAFPIVWIAMILALPRLWRVLRLSPKAGPIDHILAVAWAVVIFQSALDGFQHLYDGPHYFNASWIIYVAFLFLLARHAPAWTIAIYAASLLIVTSTIAITIHQNAGMRSPNYGSAISTQIDAVHQIEQYSGDSPLKIDIPEWKNHPFALRTLGELDAPPTTQRPRRRIDIYYRPDSSTDAHIFVTAY